MSEKCPGCGGAGCSGCNDTGAAHAALAWSSLNALNEDRRQIAQRDEQLELKEEELAHANAVIGAIVDVVCDPDGGLYAEIEKRDSRFARVVKAAKGYRSQIAGLKASVEKPWLTLIQAERKRQDVKWGEQNHDDEKWLAILVEEVGELAQAILKGGKATLGELVQTAAVGVVWLEAIERRAAAEAAQEAEKPKPQEELGPIWEPP